METHETSSLTRSFYHSEPNLADLQGVPFTVLPKRPKTSESRSRRNSGDRTDPDSDIIQSRLLVTLNQKIEQLVLTKVIPEDSQRINDAYWWIKNQISLRIDRLLRSTDGITGRWIAISKITATILVRTAPDTPPEPKPPPGKIYFRQNPVYGTLEIKMHIGQLGEGGEKRIKDTLWVDHEGAQSFAELVPKKGHRAYFEQLIAKDMPILDHLHRLQIPNIAYIEVKTFKDGKIYALPTCRSDLRSYIKKALETDPKTLDYSLTRKNVALGLSETLMLMHEKAGICHLDIKPDNILLYGSQNYPCLTDFSSGQYIDIQTRYGPRKQFLPGPYTFGTPVYYPPEFLSTNRIPVDPSADIWMFGILLHILHKGFNPFAEILQKDEIRRPLIDIRKLFRTSIVILQTELLSQKKEDPINPILYCLLDVTPIKRLTGKEVNTLLTLLYLCLDQNFTAQQLSLIYDGLHPVPKESPAYQLAMLLKKKIPSFKGPISM